MRCPWVHESGLSLFSGARDLGHCWSVFHPFSGRVSGVSRFIGPRERGRRTPGWLVRHASSSVGSVVHIPENGPIVQSFRCDSCRGSLFTRPSCRAVCAGRSCRDQCLLCRVRSRRTTVTRSSGFPRVMVWAIDGPYSVSVTSRCVVSRVWCAVRSAWFRAAGVSTRVPLYLLVFLSGTSRFISPVFSAMSLTWSFRLDLKRFGSPVHP